MRKKLLPSLFRMAQHGSISDKCKILGVARDRTLNDEQFRAWARKALAELGLQPGDTRWCDGCLHYQPADPSNPDDFGALAKRITELEGNVSGGGNRVHYLALPPQAFE